MPVTTSHAAGILFQHSQATTATRPVGINPKTKQKKRDNSLVFLFSHLAALLSHFFFFFEFVRFQRIGLRRRRLDDRWRPLPKRRTTTSNFFFGNKIQVSGIRSTSRSMVIGSSANEWTVATTCNLWRTSWANHQVTSLRLHLSNGRCASGKIKTGLQIRISPESGLA